MRLSRLDQADAVICAYLQHLDERDQPRGSEAAEVETLVHASDALAQQLMDCVSHDRALEDVLYEVSLHHRVTSRHPAPMGALAVMFVEADRCVGASFCPGHVRVSDLWLTSG